MNEIRFVNKDYGYLHFELFTDFTVDTRKVVPFKISIEDAVEIFNHIKGHTLNES